MDLKIGDSVVCAKEDLELVGVGEVITIDHDGDIGVKFHSMSPLHKGKNYMLHSCNGVDKEKKSLWFRYGSSDYPAESLIVVVVEIINLEEIKWEDLWKISYVGYCI